MVAIEGVVVASCNTDRDTPWSPSTPTTANEERHRRRKRPSPANSRKESSECPEDKIFDESKENHDRGVLLNDEQGYFAHPWKVNFCLFKTLNEYTCIVLSKTAV